MRLLRIIVCCIIFLGGNEQSSAQDPIRNPLAEELRRQRTLSNDALVLQELCRIVYDDRLTHQRSAVVSDATWFDLDWSLFRRVKRTANDVISIAIPVDTGLIELDLYRFRPLAEDFKVITASGSITQHEEIYYRGVIRGDDQSVVALSLLENELMGVISSRRHGNIVIGKDETQGLHVSYKDEDLQILNDFSCEALEVPGRDTEEISDHSRSEAVGCVEIYFEVTKDLYEELNSNVGSVISHVTGLFNVVSALYANESLSIKISEIFVWDINDPYNTSTAAKALQSFQNEKTSFNGNLAHLLDGGNGNGGIAYVDVLCDPGFAYGYSRIDKNYSGFPNYSWTVNVVAHELGHNFGSRHTQDCVWGSDQCTAIDGCHQIDPDVGCGSCEPGPLPDKGTIMSYCYLQPNIGVDFSLGFGAEPGALIRARAASASCLDDCNTANACTIEIIDVSVTDATCGEDNGVIEIEVLGGSGTILYDIGNGSQSRSTFENVPPGNYTITVTNGLSCSRSQSVTVESQGVKPKIAATVRNSACKENTGVIEINASQGTAPYTYKLGNKTQDDPIFNQLEPKDYKITVIDANGCSEDKSLTVFYDNPPSHTALVKHTSCGEENGQVLFEVEGGTAPFEYQLGSKSSQVDHFLDVAPGTYKAKVIDDNGCSSLTEVKIFDSDAIVMNVDFQSTDCGHSNGTIEIQAEGGTGTLSFGIDGVYQEESEFANLPAGDYKVSVRDELLCLEEVEVAIESSIAPTISIQPTPTSCGEKNGQVVINVEGDSGPYIFESPTAGTSMDGTFSNLPAGTFTAAVADQRGCIYTTETSISASSSPSPKIDVQRTRCGESNGVISVAVTGGIGPYGYSLNDQLQDDSIFMYLEAGSYSVVVSDATHCSDTVEISIDTSEAVFANVEWQHTNCGGSNGRISISNLNGIAPFSFLVDSVAYQDTFIDQLPAGDHRVTVTDSDGCLYEREVQIGPSIGVQLVTAVENTSCGNDNGSIDILSMQGNGPLTLTISDSLVDDPRSLRDLSPGAYTISARDSLGCEEVASFAIEASTKPSISLKKDDTHCGSNNGWMDIEISDGIGPFQTTVNGEPITDLFVSALEAGTFIIQVTDSVSCIDTLETSILESTHPVLDATVKNAYCEMENGQISLEGDLGLAPYTYSISSSPYSENFSFEQLDTGLHLVRLRDADGCIDSLSLYVAYDSQYIAPELKDMSAICEDEPATLHTGLSDHPAIHWYLGDSLITSGRSQINVDKPGTYIAAIQYLPNCILSDTSEVQEHSKPDFNLPTESSICHGSAFTLAAPNTDLIYRWSNDSIGTMIFFQESGQYTLSVENQHGCVRSEVMDLEVLSPVILLSSQTNYEICPGDAIQLEVSGALSYEWKTEDPSLEDTQSDSPTVRPDQDAIYKVIGSNQCFNDSLQISVSIASPTHDFNRDTLVVEGAPLQLHIPNIQDASWSSTYGMECRQCLNPTIRPLVDGLVSVEYVDALGCTWSDEIQVHVIPLQSLLPPLINFISPNGDGQNDNLHFEGLDRFDNATLQVFDQNGIKIFESKQYNNRWSGTTDGSMLPEGLYFYFLTLYIDERVFHFDSDLTIVRN